MNIHKASENWATRPADQRFWTLEELHKATLANLKAAREATVSASDLRVEVVDSAIQLVGRTGSPARLTNWAFKQLSSRANAPSGYLQTLPATLAAQNLNHGLKANVTDEEAKATILLHENGGYYARAILTPKYTRIWNSDIVERMLPMQDAGWVVPPARPVAENDGAFDQTNLRRATKAQAALSMTVREGDLIGPAGLYASFEDMFVFMIQPDRVIDDGSRDGLMRGMLVWNSEVGKSSFNAMKFLLRGVCGNHIIWGAQEVSEIRIPHIGNADEKAFEGLRVELKRYADSTSGEEEMKIAECRQFQLAASAEAVIDLIFDKGLLGRKTATAALEAIVPEEDGDPLTAWGYAQGITRLSQKEINADKRVALDRVAGKVLQIAF